MAIQICVPKEVRKDEQRVALVPDTVKRLATEGLLINIQSGAGELVGYTDADHENASIVADSKELLGKADITLMVNPATNEQIEQLKDGSVLIGYMDPHTDLQRFSKLKNKNISAFSMELIPRISRAQAMDALSSQASIAGYKAVLMGADALSKGIPMMTTSAGTVRPAKFVIMGSGVAGLQAIATAKRLGAVVYASDVRKSAAEQIESVGGRFIEVEGMDDFEDESGYAKPLTPEFIQKVNDTVCEVAAEADVIVTTARIFGRPAPITVPASAVASFKRGSVIVDMNADVGGNCELTQPGEVITTENGVIIIGTTNLPGLLASTASMLYSNNLTTFVATLVKEGELTLDAEDDILYGSPEGDDFHVPGMGGVLICSGGEVDSNQSRIKEAL
mgnify:CR=1 FL=1